MAAAKVRGSPPQRDVDASGGLAGHRRQHLATTAAAAPARESSPSRKATMPMTSTTSPVDHALARQAAGVTIGALFAQRVRRPPAHRAGAGPRRLELCATRRARSNRPCRHLMSRGIGRGEHWPSCQRTGSNTSSC